MSDLILILMLVSASKLVMSMPLWPYPGMQDTNENKSTACWLQ